MPELPLTTRLIAQETRALLTRLARIRPFVLHETMVPAAAPSLAAQSAIEAYLQQGRRELQGKANRFLGWLHSPQSQRMSADELQRRFTFLRMQFNLVLSQFDIFADVITQRSEHLTGVWLGGLDSAAEDALAMPGGYYTPPAVVCYLDRGHGAAIRRARTRLPGGGENPVAIIRVPRERMVGAGVASSLVHEVGHQGAALLHLVESLRPVLAGLSRTPGLSGRHWAMWERWISEILSDLWSASRVGIAAPLGLMGVVSLPRAFVFRISLDDPHPIPWIRVKLSCAMGDGLYPHPQWQILANAWERFYPLDGLPPERRQFFREIEAAIPAFVSLLLSHRPRSLRGRSLGEAMHLPDRTPARLRALFGGWRRNPMPMRSAPPTLVFAALGQARADGALGPERESRLLAGLLEYWAMRSTLSTSEICSRPERALAPALAA